MAKSATIPLVVCAFAVFSISVAVAQETGPTLAAEITGIDKKLDAMPPAFLRKMLRGGRLVGSPGLTWQDKSVLTVAFKGGSDELYQLIEQTANEWTASGGRLSLSFKDDAGHYRLWTTDDTVPAADIRISFDKHGYYSAIGALAAKNDPNEETMNYEGFPEGLKKFYGGQNADEWRFTYFHRTILHEFGHALGLSHEHFNPQCQNDIDLTKIIPLLEGPPDNWSEDVARFNMDAQYYVQRMKDQSGGAFDLFNSSSTDQKSVMLYMFPSKYYKSGDKSPCAVIGDHNQRWSTTLSQGDKQFFLANYGVAHSPLGGTAGSTRPNGNAGAAPALQ
jgi:hypothetical protein